MQSRDSPKGQKITVCAVYFVYINSRNANSSRKITGYLGIGVWARRKDYQRARGNFVDDRYVHYLSCGNSFMGACILCKNIKLYTLNR